MPRDRSRGRVARPDETAPAEDGSDEAEDDDDPTPDLSERGGTIDDLLDDQVGSVEQQVLSGSQADLRIAPEVNPGFVDTEVVNRMGLVLSLNLEFDPSRQQWVPAVVDRTERQAVEQTLAEDRATDDVGGVVDPGDGTNVNQDGDLELSDDSYDVSGYDGRTQSTSYANGTLHDDFEVQEPITSLTVEMSQTPDSTGVAQIEEFGGGPEIAREPLTNGLATFNISFEAGDTISIGQPLDGGDGDVHFYDSPGPPYESDGLVDYGYGADIGDPSDRGVWITGLSADNTPESGTATTSIDNPCTATSTRTAQYDVCSKSSDVTVDLYNGDPDSDDSTLLARDIDQREDISDLPDAFTDLQYKLTLRRDDSGESPKVSRLGHQIIR
jgi:hypothetical protein